jgi:hypothetical protein
MAKNIFTVYLFFCIIRNGQLRLPGLIVRIWKNGAEPTTNISIQCIRRGRGLQETDINWLSNAEKAEGYKLKAEHMQEKLLRRPRSELS